MNYIRTDLAVEAFQEGVKIDSSNGINIQEEDLDYGIKITDVRVENIQGEKILGKSIGRYITLDTQQVDDNDEQAAEKIVEVLADKIDELVADYKNDGVLVVGLGNRSITPDSLGPSVCDNVLVSRHIKVYSPELIDERISELSAIAPGVLGITGIETVEVIKGVAEKIKPGVIIAIDSLASRKLCRVSTTYQLTDTGISPGSGIGNKRKSINSDELGIPVIAIGVPFVVYAATIASDLIEQTLVAENIYKEEDLEHVVQSTMNKIMNVDGAQMVVTPKEIDIIVERCGNIIAAAINKVVANGVQADMIDRILH